MSDFEKEFGNKILDNINDCLERVIYLRDRIEYEHNGGLTPDISRSKEISKASEELLKVCQCWEVYVRPYDKEYKKQIDEEVKRRNY